MFAWYQKRSLATVWCQKQLFRTVYLFLGRLYEAPLMQSDNIQSYWGINGIIIGFRQEDIYIQYID